ncbi:LOW QUALITY PROTEIN: testis-specific H1 histone, partial [Nannospalax galili]|uniref:LOW QUALITY PROTEIN: testis-specific H1 histone n=1 Tax=Nannospalax galili TaxID=1026970 RepID=UPI0004ED3DA2
MAEAAQPTSESDGTEVPVKQPADKMPRTASRRRRQSVLRVSQVLLGAITAPGRPTLAALKKALGSAGYEVRRKIGSPVGGPGGSETQATLLRVSGSHAAGCFRVWKLPKSRRKAGRSRLALDGRSSRGNLPRSSRPHLHRSRRKAAEKAREAWRSKAKALRPQVRRARSRIRSRARSPARSGAKSRVRNQARIR